MTRRRAAIPPRRARGSGVTAVYDAVKRDILDMTLQPGFQLDETALAQRFALSRTPVREAMVRLVAEGLATTLPNRNTIVAPVDFATLPQYLDALTLMYRVTTRSAALNRAPADLDRLNRAQAAFAAAVAASDAIAMIDTNRVFHIAIAEAAGNPYYRDLFTRLLNEGARLLRLYYKSYQDHLPQQFVEEHDAMIAAIEAGDGNRAEQLGAAHAAQIVRQLQGFLEPDTGAAVTLA